MDMNGTMFIAVKRKSKAFFFEDQRHLV
jgi:hypothetical protein